ncbi:hypothetical protein AKJ64_01185 [candidate division MSBL1 archaeon SCGC-AAA259E17]|uniref:ISXO2-like transposase domain-containing protein n=1 Tax=candidate division MSBL1 archaeon SCGC-AAA259E17 TaxID=1698263 RepID=A0A133UGH4_9EURY|nr:hypothetical protein AKJ64_01185 [candidate division MSBL1 archaeon SCGC-AAA259E17]
MLAKAFDVNSSFIWRPLTLLIRAFLLDKVKFCPDCGSESVVKDGHNRRENIPRVQMFQCKNCGRRFVERANTIFYWKHSSMGELFIITWIFFEGGSRNWAREWISSIGEYSCAEWFERVENALVGAVGNTGGFVDGIFQADEMQIRSFGEKPLVFGVKGEDGKVFETPLPGDSALEFKSALERADEELGSIIVLDTDGHASYPQAAEWLGIHHRPVNRSEEGFVDGKGIHSNGVENLWSHDRPWIEAARGYSSMKTLKRAVKAHQAYKNQVKNSPAPVWAFLKITISNPNKGYFLLSFITRFHRECRVPVSNNKVFMKFT